MLAVERDFLALDDFAFSPIPARPPHAGRQVAGIKLNADVVVVELPQDGAPPLAFARVAWISWIAVSSPILQRDRLAQIEGLGQQDLGREDLGPDLAQLRGYLPAALPNVNGQDVGVAKVWDAVDAGDNRLDHLQSASAVYPAVNADVNMVVQRERLMPTRSKRLGHLLLGQRRHGVATGEHADSRRSVPKPPEPVSFVLGETESLDKHRQGRPTQQPAGQRARDGVFELMRSDLDVGGSSRHDAQMAGEDLSHC